MNEVQLVGRLTKDPQSVDRPNSRKKTNFILAIPRHFETKDGVDADFIYCTAWGRLADNVATYCTKGMQVAVSGRIQTRFYEVDGERKYITEVIARNVQFLSKPNRLSSFVEEDETAAIF